jgi:hypothetical protein
MTQRQLEILEIYNKHDTEGESTESVFVKTCEETHEKIDQIIEVLELAGRVAED